MLGRHGRQHLGRWQGAGIIQARLRGGQGCAVVATAVGGVQRSGNGAERSHQLGTPFHQRDFLAPALQPQAGLAAPGGGVVLVAGQCGDFVGGVVRAVGQQAVQQEDVDEAHGLRVDAHRQEGVQVEQAHLDVFHAPLAQGMQGALAREDHPLGADGAVELVFDLQQAGGQLVVVAARVTDTHGLVGGVGAGQGVLQRGAVAVQAVVAHRQGGLGVALVAEAPHTQRGAVGHEHGAVAQRQQLVRTASHEGGAQRGGCTEQVQQQKCMSAEVADQAEILLAGHTGQRPVVVDARNGLHAPAITVAQAHAIHTFGPPDVGAAVAPDGNGLVGGQAAGHAGHPQHLVAQVAQAAVGELVQRGEFVQHGLHLLVGAGDQLDLRLAEVGGDMRVGQRRAQRRRVRGERQHAGGGGAQAFLFHAAPHAAQALDGERSKAILQVGGGVAGGNTHKLITLVSVVERVHDLPGVAQRTLRDGLQGAVRSG